MSEEAPAPILHSCEACGHAMDVTDVEPFTTLTCPVCQASVLARARFDHFKILREVGVGGMSRVFEAEDISLGRHVALKILNRECSHDAVRLAQFEREARLTASFNHPCIVKVYSIGRDQGHFYIAMELVPGGSLDERIRLHGAMPEDEALALAIQLGQSLRAAHHAGLIHRDIKPGNILFAEDGTAKLVDFGLALVQGDRDESGELWATPYYVPPEKLSNEPDTHRGDMYSLGATLFHALAGKPPYAKDTNSIEELQRIKSFPVHLRPLAPHLSDETCAIIDRLLSRKPEHRYRSYDELLEHFEFARRRLQEKAAQAGVPAWRKQLRSPPALVTVSALSLVAVLAIVMTPHGKPPGPPPPAPLLTPENMAESATARFLQARESLIAGLTPRARSVFTEIAQSPTTRQPTLNWTLFNVGLCALLEHDSEGARRAFSALAERSSGSEPGLDPELTQFFADTANVLAQAGRASGDAPDRFDGPGVRGAALLPLGIRAWMDGRADRSEELLRRFVRFTPPPGQSWIESCRALAAPYLADFDAVDALPQADETLDRESLEASLGEAEKIVAALKTPGGPLRPLAEARADEFRRLLAQRISEEEERRVTEDMQRAQAEAEALDMALEKIRPFRASYRFAEGLDILRRLQPATATGRERTQGHVYLWQSADQFLRSLADDLNGFGFTGTLERVPPLPAVPEVTIVKAAPGQWLVRAGRVETSLETSVCTPAFLISLAGRLAEKTSDSDAYYQRRAGIAAFAKLCGLDEYAAAAAASLMKESPVFREEWARAAQLTGR